MLERKRHEIPETVRFPAIIKLTFLNKLLSMAVESCFSGKSHHYIVFSVIYGEQLP
jgi:hypothetical protein